MGRAQLKNTTHSSLQPTSASVRDPYRFDSQPKVYRRAACERCHQELDFAAALRLSFGCACGGLLRLIPEAL